MRRSAWRWTASSTTASVRSLVSRMVEIGRGRVGHTSKPTLSQSPARLISNLSLHSCGSPAWWPGREGRVTSHPSVS